MTNVRRSLQPGQKIRTQLLTIADMSTSYGYSSNFHSGWWPVVIGLLEGPFFTVSLSDPISGKPENNAGGGIDRYQCCNSLYDVENTHRVVE